MFEWMIFVEFKKIDNSNWRIMRIYLIIVQIILVFGAHEITQPSIT